MPLLLRELLEHAIELQDDCELLQDTRRGLQTLAGNTAAPDIVVLGLSADEDATILPPLFARWPTAQIVTLTRSGEDAMAYELIPRRRVLGPRSPAEIIATAHDAVQKSRALLQE
jgi:DNA-binding NarL/FixJ family response regulator